MSFERFSPTASCWDQAASPTAVTLPLERDPRVHEVFNEIEFLEAHERHPGLSEMQWFTLLRDLRHVADNWLDRALALGWPLLSLFGSPMLLGGRAGLLGVAPLLKGRSIESIDRDRIIIANRLGPPGVFRHPPAGADHRGSELIWHVLSNGEIA